VQKDFKTFPPIPQGGFGIVIVSFLPIEMFSFLGNPVAIQTTSTSPTTTNILD
jgi:hypothetical protein